MNIKLQISQGQAWGSEGEYQGRRSLIRFIISFTQGGRCVRHRRWPFKVSKWTQGRMFIESKRIWCSKRGGNRAIWNSTIRKIDKCNCLQKSLGLSLPLKDNLSRVRRLKNLLKNETLKRNLWAPTSMKSITKYLWK